MTTPRTQIKLKFKAYDYNLLDNEVGRVFDTVKRTGAEVSGPIPMPCKIERFTVNRSPHVDKESREQFERKTFRRVMIISPSDQTIDALMKLELASGVQVAIKVLEGGK
jgi:small subunit ribosomal protein S10